ncbi:MAG: transposase, partial [Eubacteriales bacterium]|nr:transposase [Eubacteriales bacterium]
MAEKDVTEKILESYNDVFSDIVNVLLFQGKQ